MRILTREELLQELIALNAFLCPEPGGHWSVHAIFGEAGKPDFMGWGESPEEAINKAKTNKRLGCL